MDVSVTPVDVHQGERGNFSLVLSNGNSYGLTLLPFVRFDWEEAATSWGLISTPAGGTRAYTREKQFANEVGDHQLYVSLRSADPTALGDEADDATCSPMVRALSIAPVEPLTVALVSARSSDEEWTVVAFPSGGVPPYSFSWVLPDGNTIAGDSRMDGIQAGQAAQVIVSDDRGGVATGSHTTGSENAAASPTAPGWEWQVRGYPVTIPVIVDIVQFGLLIVVAALAIASLNRAPLLPASTAQNVVLTEAPTPENSPEVTPDSPALSSAATPNASDANSGETLGGGGSPEGVASTAEIPEAKQEDASTPTPKPPAPDADTGNAAPNPSLPSTEAEPAP